ncbi:MAG: methionyl-tRNA formyltransferase [Nitrospiraceae bacterium]|nr:methionyl-tRNA formyltransferase [Nitrospiraceae bacterium]
MRIVFFGTPAFAVPSLRALADSDMDIVAAVTQPDRVKGRGHLLAAPPVKEFALQRGIPVLQPPKIRTAEFLSELTALRPDLMAVVAYGRILPGPVLGLPRLGCVNVHGSLLPKYRGAAPIQWAIINGDDRTGITTMLMDEGLDTGDMLLREETRISDEDTAESLGVRLSGIGASLLLKTIAGLKDGTIPPVPQTGEPSFAPPLKKEDGRIDWQWPSRRIFNLVRGTYPWPGAHCSLNGERIVVLRASVSAGAAAGSAGAGTITAAGGGMQVMTGDGALTIIELKPEGKKAMRAADFVNGRRVRAGMRFDAL